MISVEEARLRGIGLPVDDDAAQDIIDEQEAWLARRIGLLVGERTETFYVGLAVTHGKLGLRRYTDSVVVTDGGVAVTHFRMVDSGSAVRHTYSAASQWWTGPYVTAKYTPTDEDEVRKALFDLVGLASQPLSPYESEQIGSYSYRRGGAPGTLSLAAQKAAIVASLLPTHDPLLTIHSGRRLGFGDPVINRAELPT